MGYIVNIVLMSKGDGAGDKESEVKSLNRSMCGHKNTPSPMDKQNDRQPILKT